MRYLVLVAAIACSEPKPVQPTATPPAAQRPIDAPTATPVDTPSRPIDAPAATPVVDTPTPIDAGVAMVSSYGGAMTLRALLADLLAQAKSGMPTAQALRDRYAPRAKAVTTAGPNLDHPPWAESIHDGNDTFLELDGDLAGMQLWEDSRGWGAYAELAITKGTLADVEAVAGKTKPVPRNPDDFHSGPTVAVYVGRGDNVIRVFAELAKQGRAVRRLMIHFER